MDDLAVIVVSTNEGRWLPACLSSVFRLAGDVRLDVVVADNRSTDGTRELVEQRFPRARVVSCDNRGFAHANNRALMTCDARYVLFLNPDTEILEGTLGELVAACDRRPALGLAGVKQVDPDGTLWPTMRRFPNALRAMGEAFASERWPVRSSWLGERELDLALYERDVACDWVSGSFLLVRREAIESAGFMDERFFIYSEETDLCLRIKRAGWEVRHLPQMTILHHFGKGGVSPKMEAQSAYARMQYARKHFSPAHRASYLAAVAIGYGLRLTGPGHDRAQRVGRRRAAWSALRLMARVDEPPFGLPPRRALLARRESSADRNMPGNGERPSSPDGRGTANAVADRRGSA